MEERFTRAQIDLALRKEQLILRLERGEPLDVVSQELGLTYHPKHVSRLRRQYIDGGRHWMALVDESRGRPAQITDEIVQWMASELQRDPGVTASSLCAQVEKLFEVEIGERRMQQLARESGYPGQRGRPYQASPSVVVSTEPLVKQTPCAGIFFPAGCVVAYGNHAGDAARVGEMQGTVSAAIPGTGVTGIDEPIRNRGE